VKRGIIIGAIVLVALSAGGWYAWRKWGRREKPPAYRTVKIERGAIVQSVRATGTVQPRKLVQVGTQVNGPILKLGADFNSRVQAGDVVAQIDPAVYQANLAQGEANLARGRAAVDEARARVLQASNDLARAAGLARRDLLSPADLDAASTTAVSAEAQLKVTLATVAQNEAALQLARANLGYTTIRTPVDGIVISRNVDEGQTVVASMSAQTLFTVATDLRTVLISASVPEADIGLIRQGQSVTFNVDAYPAIFTGSVDQVRLSASSVQNVVTYPVIVRADNPDQKLFPGMTANISCIVAERTNTLKVANAALRFKPPARPAGGGGKPDKPDRSDKSDRPAGPEKEGEGRGKLWVAEADGSLRPIRVTTGISDGSFTEIGGDGLEEGLEIVTGMAENGGKPGAVNPFMPTPPSRRMRPRM
jgi:HlyD family secretion protein